jgi:hypothetical protein
LKAIYKNAEHVNAMLTFGASLDAERFRSCKVGG